MKFYFAIYYRKNTYHRDKLPHKKYAIEYGERLEMEKKLKYYPYEQCVNLSGAKAMIYHWILEDKEYLTRNRSAIEEVRATDFK